MYDPQLEQLQKHVVYAEYVKLSRCTYPMETCQLQDLLTIYDRSAIAG
jgi:hypothetical protein